MPELDAQERRRRAALFRAREGREPTALEFRKLNSRGELSEFWKAEIQGRRERLGDR